MNSVVILPVLILVLLFAFACGCRAAPRCPPPPAAAVVGSEPKFVPTPGWNAEPAPPEPPLPPPQEPLINAAPAPFLRACGKSVVPQPRILGGADTYPGKHPWAALVTNTKTGNVCGASVLHAYWILTSASCVKASDLGNITVSVGVYDSYTVEQSRRDLKPIAIIPHPQYDGTKNDICLVKVSTPISFGDYVQPVCFPGKDFTTRKENKYLLIGWGGKGTDRSFSRYLQEAVMTPVQCPASADAATQFCATGASTCAGDPGSPLMLQMSDSSYVQVGIVSSSDCTAGSPVVFTNVYKYYSWMVDVFSKN